jgi:hypothetical protein
MEQSLLFGGEWYFSARGLKAVRGRYVPTKYRDKRKTIAEPFQVSLAAFDGVSINCKINVDRSVDRIVN